MPLIILGLNTTFKWMNNKYGFAFKRFGPRIIKKEWFKIVN
ncbi:hypothetical protein BN8_06534 [Fibrisoma limi BUZ 3]|uniref:Uncharacterized protein n=1 Tax=Fibrisoma limi BUZ 3 TaxID=1185876 RepID=I2GTA1_9BACT|nr:hypothetical protein BN8_06534 [Fibrisoma limi BUZ 3]